MYEYIRTKASSRTERSSIVVVIIIMCSLRLHLSFVLTRNKMYIFQYCYSFTHTNVNCSNSSLNPQLILKLIAEQWMKSSDECGIQNRSAAISTAVARYDVELLSPYEYDSLVVYYRTVP